jgi:hypothetical protein
MKWAKGSPDNMTESNSERAYGSEDSIIRCSIGNVQFPEICPVCLKDAEDLVAVTVIERGPGKEGSDTHSSWGKGGDKAAAALEAARGATVFWIPTCLRHGSGSVRTERKRIIAFAAYFIMFYPILYFFLSLRNAMIQERPLEIPLFGLVITALVFLYMVFYGFYPRALERAIRILDTERSKDRLYLAIRKDEYREAFLELNGMHCEPVDSVGRMRFGDKTASEGSRGGQ